MSRDNTKKVVVTGTGGFLGSNLVEALKGNEGYFVYALSSQGEKLQESNTNRNIQYCHKDAIFSDEGELILKDAIVVNCAFPRNSTGMDMADGLRYIQRVFDRSKECRSKAIINISSQSVYSQTREEPATEETPVCLESPYAVGKYVTELMLESVCRGNWTRFTNLRMASLIGPGFNQRIVNRLAMRMLNGESITLIRQDKKMGFLDIEDAVKAIYDVLNYPIESWKPVYNVGNGKGYTVEEIYSVVSTSVIKRVGNIGSPVYEEGTDRTSSEVLFEQLCSDVGYHPCVTLEDSVEKIIDHITSSC